MKLSLPVSVFSEEMKISQGSGNAPSLALGFSIEISVSKLVDMLVELHEETKAKKEQALANESPAALDPNAVGTHGAADHGAASPDPAVVTDAPAASEGAAAAAQPLLPPSTQLPTAEEPPDPAPSGLRASAEPFEPSFPAAPDTTWESPMSEVQYHDHEGYVRKTKWKVSPLLLMAPNRWLS